MKLRSIVHSIVVWGLVVAVGSRRGVGQIGSGTGSLGSIGSSDASAAGTVSGRVMNAANGQPVPRALVKLNAQAMLADSEGRFEFGGVGTKTAHLEASKPGFYGGLDPMMASAGVEVDLEAQASGIEIRLYPEAVLSGTVAGPDGEPLRQVLVEASPNPNDEAQGPMGQRQAFTNARGEFRMVLPAGDYVVRTSYMSHGSDFPEAVLPVVFPPNPSGGTPSLLHLAAGSEERIALRPDVQPTHHVTIRIEAQGGGFMPMLQARLNNQVTFNVDGVRTIEDVRTGGPGKAGMGLLLRAELPNGSYTLMARTVSRREMMGRVTRTEGQMAYAESEVTVADKDVDGVVLRFASLPEVQATMVIDPPSMSDNAAGGMLMPALAQLGLWLKPTSGVAQGPQYLVVRPGGDAGFPVAPGTYRVRAQAGGTWFVKSATSGSTDLLTHDLEVAPGGASGGILVTVSNQTGSVHGTVKLAGKAAACSVVLVATTPSASPLEEMRSSVDGSFNRTNVPPGHYLAVGFETRPNGNLLDPAIQEEFAAWTKAVDVAAGETAELELDAVPAAELKP